MEARERKEAAEMHRLLYVIIYIDCIRMNHEKYTKANSTRTHTYTYTHSIAYSDSFTLSYTKKDLRY